MDRAFLSGASASAPTPPASPSIGYATEGNPGTGTPPTKPGPWWYHMITEEFRKIVVDAGLTPDYTNTSQVSQAVQALISASSAASLAFKNKLINGGMAIDQRNSGAAQTFTAGAALAYCVDRWYGYCTGANVNGQRVAGTGQTKYRYQFTGAASNTGIGFGQRIESENATALAGLTARLSVDLANSLLTTVTWTAYYANSADSFGTLASPTRTQIATGSFTVSGTLARYSVAIAVPAAAAAGIEVVFTVAGQTSGTFVIGDVQLEAGSTASGFDRRAVGQELALCQRYGFMVPTGAAAQQGWAGAINAGIANITVSLPVTMRVAPTVPSISWTLSQANTPNFSAASTGRVDWTTSGTLSNGSASASNSAPFFLNAEL